MMKLQRYSPLVILFDLWNTLKFSFFIFIYLFIINNSDSMFMYYLKIGFLFLLVLGVLHLILKWFTTTYYLTEQAFYLQEGIFVKRKRTVPFSKIHNVNRNTTFMHQLFQRTSIQFETGLSGDEATIKFEVVTRAEADSLERKVMSQEIEMTGTVEYNKVTHFIASRKDIMKASVTSLSFLLLIPILLSIFHSINDVYNVESEAKGIIGLILSSWSFTVTVVIFLIIASALFGIIRTFIKYGNYQIRSDSSHIYISRGIVDETSFTIHKDKVQAIEISQTLMKRILKIVEVKLVSAGQTGSDDASLEKSSLYPFLPNKTAYKLISELLPDYTVKEEMHRLPKNALIARLLQPSWIWIIATFALLYFQPNFLSLNIPWWVLSIGLLVLIFCLRILDYLNSRYVINEQFIQFKSGSLTTSTFLTRRDKVIEIEISQGPLERILGIATAKTINRAQPVHHCEINGIPNSFKRTFYQWYKKRQLEVQVVDDVSES